MVIKRRKTIRSLAPAVAWEKKRPLVYSDVVEKNLLAEALDKVISGQCRRIEIDSYLKGNAYRAMIYRCSDNLVRADFKKIAPAAGLKRSKS
jgi:hypothetical protein